MVGETISHYRVLEKLGEGGMGIVYKAEDTRLQRFVALKFLPKEYAHDTGLRERFLREARAASALNHPNICTIYDVGEENHQIFIAMEFLDGVTLKEMAQRGPLPQPQLLSIAINIAEGVEAAHSEGIIHRDIKLANIFATRSGRVKILDFGLAKKTASKQVALTAAVGSSADSVPERWQMSSGLAALGTAAYMSPEQALGKTLDERTDLFSFGVVLYEMATGQAPFRGDTTGMLFLSIVQDTPEPVRQFNPDVPDEFQRIVTRCLEKDRDRRYQHVSEILTDLRRMQPNSGSHNFAVAGVLDETHKPPVAGGLNAESVAKSLKSSSAQVLDPRSAKPPEAKPRRWIWKATLAALAILGIVIGGIYYLHSRKAIALAPHAGIVLADFANTTGDPIFDGTLRQALAVDLRQSPFLNVVADREVRAALKQMEKPAGERISSEVAREVCLRTNSQAFIAGAIAPDGKGYRIELQALTCDKGEVLAAAETEAANRDAVIKALGETSRHLRRELGESLPSLQQFNKPLPEATTSSLEALQAYAIARSAQTGELAAIPYYKRAVELDPNFALAYAGMGISYANLGEQDRANEQFTRAYELRNRVTDRERFYLEAIYYRYVTGETAKAKASCEAGLRSYPDTATFYTWLGFTYLESGELEKAAATFEKSRRLMPESPAPYVNLMVAYTAMDKLDEAKITFEDARKRNLDDPSLRVNRYTLAFLESDTAAMQEQVEAAKGRPGYEDPLLDLQAETEAYYGHFRRAHELDQQARSSAEQAGGADSVLQYDATAAWREAAVGNSALARQRATSALVTGHDRTVKQMAAMALALSGDIAAASTLADELASQYPLDTLTQNYVVPTVRALVQLDQHQAAKAVETLRPALGFELAAGDIENMQPTYARGLAYLQLGKGPQAAAEFRKMIDHPGIIGNCVTGALAHLQLARAEAMSGNTESARTDYQDFLAIWKDADPNIPAYRQAKAEYAKLK